MGTLHEWGNLRFTSLDSVLGKRTAFTNFSSLESLNKSVAQDESPGKYEPNGAISVGWHFYGYLHLSHELFDETNASKRLTNVYDRLAKAASLAISKSRIEIRLLEHQGQVLHFFIATKADAYGVKCIKEFATSLAAYVHMELFGAHSREQGIVNFTMAAEFGSSIILYIPPATEEESAGSRVSLGCCANNPAKLLFGNHDIEPWCLHYRCNADSEWLHYLSETDIRLVASDICNRRKDFGSLEGLQEAYTIIMPKRDAEHPILKHGFVFKADLDKFTKHVAAAFANDKMYSDYPHTQALANEFIAAARSINKWQHEGGGRQFNFAASPWSGDCCTMAVFLRGERDSLSLLRELHSDDSKRLAKFRDVPIELMSAWDDFVSRHLRSEKFSNWTCSLSFGKIAFFDTSAAGHEFRMLSGLPVTVSNVGVNLNRTEAGELVMLKREIYLINPVVARTFNREMGFGYVAQPQEMR